MAALLFPKLHFVLVSILDNRHYYSKEIFVCMSKVHSAVVLCLGFLCTQIKLYELTLAY